MAALDALHIAAAVRVGAAMPTEAEIVKGITTPGRYDVTVGSEGEAWRLLQQAMPNAVELPPAVPGQPYPKPPPGCKSGINCILLNQMSATPDLTLSTQTGLVVRKAGEAVGVTLNSNQFMPELARCHRWREICLICLKSITMRHQTQ